MITIKRGIFQKISGIKKKELGTLSRNSNSTFIRSRNPSNINISESTTIKPIKDRLIARRKKNLKLRNLSILSKTIYFRLKQFLAFLHLFLYAFSIFFPFFLSNLEAIAPFWISPSIIVPIENFDLTSVILIAPI